MTTVPLPDLGARPLTVECTARIAAPPAAVFAAWSTDIDRWFAQPGTVAMVPEPGRPYFFYNRDDWGRHPHYGRFLSVHEHRLLEMTWITGNGTQEGTAGAETVLRIELDGHGGNTGIRLLHSGFVSEASRAGHQDNWPLALDELAAALASG
ncbi:MAG: SRPBCC domain-containing protein [Pseudomonadota bacterium]